jgi:ribose transport system substrate-binding protein
MSAASFKGDPYLVGAFLQAYQVMASFRSNEALRLRDVVARTGLAKGTAFRILYTLYKTGFLEKTDPNQYRLRITLPAKNRYRLGFDMNENDTGFTAVVSESLVRAASNASAELLVLGNQDGKLSLQNAESLIRERVNLAIVFQGDQSIAEALAAKYADAGIPMIAVDVPHPGAYFFGANNYRAGVLGGRYLGRWANLHWPNETFNIVLIEYRRAGSIPQSRVSGMLAGFRDSFRDYDKCTIFHLDSIGDYASGYEVVKKHLHQRQPRKTLVAAVNDPAALAAIHAFEEAGFCDSCAVISQSAEPRARAEMRRPASCLIGSVAYFPEKYGPHLISLARKILVGPIPPPATFTRHVLITPENVDRVYPDDEILSCVNGERPITAGVNPLGEPEPLKNVELG